MIELSIPVSSILAIGLSVLMGCCIFAMIIALLANLSNKCEWIFAAMVFLFVFDGRSALASGIYANQPTNGTELFDPFAPAHLCYDSSASNFKTFPCEYPPADKNPFELQPLHPIRWSISSTIWTVETGVSTLNGAIKVKVT